MILKSNMCVILGIDVGVRNLSVCALDPQEIACPKTWVLLDIRGKTPHEIIKNLISQLDELDLVHSQEISSVYVETQMHKQMIGIAYSILTYFNIYGVDAQFIGASAKKKYLVQHENYADRKKSSIEAVTTRLDAKGKDMLRQYQKQDDLCDSYLYALVGCEKKSQTKTSR